MTADEFVRLCEALRQQGATHVRASEFEAHFAPSASIVTPRERRIIERPAHPPESGDQRQEWRNQVAKKLANG